MNLRRHWGGTPDRESNAILVRLELFPAHRRVEPRLRRRLEARRPYLKQNITPSFTARAVSPGAFGDPVEANYLGVGIVKHGATRGKEAHLGEVI